MPLPKFDHAEPNPDYDLDDHPFDPDALKPAEAIDDVHDPEPVRIAPVWYGTDGNNFFRYNPDRHEGDWQGVHIHLLDGDDGVQLTREFRDARIWTGDGADTVTNWHHAAIVHGGTGIDAIHGNPSGGVTVRLDLRLGWTNRNPDHKTELHSIEQVSGSAVSDTIIGDGFDNILFGARGGDFIAGGGGSDFIRGGLSDIGDIDVLMGGAGRDYFIFHIGEDDWEWSVDEANYTDKVLDFTKGEDQLMLFNDHMPWGPIFGNVNGVEVPFSSQLDATHIDYSHTSDDAGNVTTHLYISIWQWDRDSDGRVVSSVPEIEQSHIAFVGEIDFTMSDLLLS